MPKAFVAVLTAKNYNLCETSRAVYISDVERKQFYNGILDYKMIVPSRAP